MATLEWTQPPQMTSAVAASWRAFYRRTLDVYGITPEQYRLLYIAQKGRCWICRKVRGIHPDDPKGAGSRRLGVDHNHATGAVRGLLCTYGDKSCNRVIGFLDHAALLRAARYLRTPPALVLAEVAHLAPADREACATAWLWGDD